MEVLCSDVALASNVVTVIISSGIWGQWFFHLGNPGHVASLVCYESDHTGGVLCATIVILNTA